MPPARREGSLSPVVFLAPSRTLALPLLAALTLSCGSDEASSGGGSGSGGADAADAADAAGGSGGNGGSGGSGGSSGSAGTGGAAGAAGAGGNSDAISDSMLSAIEAETNVAVAPNDYVMATWIAVQFDGSSSNGYAFSTDRGQTWQAPRVLDSPDGRVSSDPVVYADESSNFYLSWIGFQRDAQGQPFDMRVYAAKAPAGATELGPVIDVTGPVASDSVDKPWITVDPNDGTIYITWLDTGEPRMRVAVSSDGAQSFDTYAIDDGQGFRNLIFPCVDAATGRVYATYHPGGGIGLRWSDDKGQTWPQATAVADQNDPPAMFDDPTCAARDGKVWVAYGIGSDQFAPTDNPRSDRLRVAYSEDGGQSITARYFAEDPSAGSKFLHPQLAATDDGTLHLLYYAGGDQVPDPTGTVRLARSTDGGQTWQPSEIVRQPIDFLTARGDPQWLGDYIGLLARGNALYGVYVDNTGGLSHVHFFSR